MDEKGQGIERANVFVLDAQRGAVTDPDGRFVVTRIPVGTYWVRVKTVGFAKEDRQRVPVTEGNATTVDFRLHLETLRIRPLPQYGGER